ncbi:MAG: hypothetical protein VCD00_05190 [Candidatus Hydrogenedentota bacterium]
MTSTLLTLVLTLTHAATVPYQVFPYSATSENAALYVLPGSHPATSNIVILDGTELTVYPSNATHPSLRHQIDPNTLLFDLFDTNDDDIPELFTLLPDALFHYPEPNNQTKITLFGITPSLPWLVTQPFIHPIILSYDNAHLAAIPYQNNITLKTFEGKTLSTLPKILSDTHSLFTIPVSPNQIGSPDAFEFKVDTLLTTAINIPRELRPAPSIPGPTFTTPRLLRESEQRDLDLWPAFPLTDSPDNNERVIFASYAPEHVHTIIRIKRDRPTSAFTQTELQTYTPERIYPGTIATSQSGYPDFNADGYHDLVMWRMALPGRSINTMINSLRSQTWPIELTVHLYDRNKRRYTARPTARIKTTVAIQFILMRQNQSPLRNLSFADLNNDGASDLTLSPQPDTLETWVFENGFEPKPNFRSRFQNPVELISPLRQETNASTATLLLRDKTTIYRVNAPSDN